MTVLIITGPAASGKNTISTLVSPKRKECAVIDVDQVRHMFSHPHKAAWDGEEGKIQQRIGVENACLLAKNFNDKGVDVVILDVIVNQTAQTYRKYFPEAKIVLLMPSYEETLRRFKDRSSSITEEEFKTVYEWQENLTEFDEKIDNTNLTPEEVANLLEKLWR